jgi:AcrR family transcriptional regulator
MPADERRAAIVQATLPLLATHGETVTTRQIAEAACVAEGTIFRVFHDKDELLLATLDVALDQGPSEAAYAAIDSSVEFEQQLVVAVDIIQRRIVDVWAVVSNLGPKLREQASRPLTDSDALIALFQPEQDRLTVSPRAAARMLRALTLAVTHPMLAEAPMTAEQIVEQFLHGTLTEGTR